MRKPRGGCKQDRDGYHDGYHTHNNDVHFFKVLVGNFRESLTIPEKFVQHFNGRPEGTVTLESRGGYTWDVEVTNKLGKVVFQTGWKAFVSAHDLKMLDFLVFKYDGYSQFNVLIFDPNGCEKVLPYPPEVNVEERSRQTIDISSSSSIKSPLKSPASNREEAWKPRDGGYFSSSGDRKSHAVPRYILPKRICLTGGQKKELNKKISAIHSDIPIYVCIIRENNISGRTQTLYISGEYAGVYLPFKVQNVLLCRHGKRWEVKCHDQEHGKVMYKRFMKGWKEFAQDNYLQLGDLCLLELIENKTYTMNVHIIPENEICEN